MLSIFYKIKIIFYIFLLSLNHSLKSDRMNRIIISHFYMETLG